MKEGDLLNSIITEKIRTWRWLSVILPLLIALLMSFGNDYVVFHTINTGDDYVELQQIKHGMLTSNLVMLVGLAIATFASNTLFRLIIRQELVTPLLKLRTGMEEIRRGNYEYQITYEESDSMFEIYDDFNEMAVEMRRFATTARDVEAGRKQLLLSISHDLRSPLTSIIAYVQGLIDGIARTEEKKLHYLNNIKTKALDIDKMVNRLFVFARLESDGYHTAPTVISVGSHLRTYVESVQNEYASTNYKIRLDVVSDGNIYVDEELFDRICTNLLDNSIKYNDKDQGQSVIRVVAGRKFMKISFLDNGPGVPLEDLSRLWDLFYRTDEARKNPGKSNGIGLSIVKKAVETMNGKVTAKNRPKGGLEIMVRIPICKEDSPSV